MAQENETTARLSKAESARINGSHSHGPSSEEGRRNSANANLRHGAYSKRVLLDNEDAAFYENFKAAHHNHFLPRDPFEFQCVESMITAAWRIRRMESAEAKLLNIALAANRPANEATFDQLDVSHERAIAVESKLQSVDSLTRVQERLHRIYERNFKLLATARKKSAQPAPDPIPSAITKETERTSPVPEPELKPPEQTIDPTVRPAPATSIVTQIVIFLVIFALMLIAPAPLKAGIPQFSREIPALYAPHALKSRPLAQPQSDWTRNPAEPRP